jgi:hypothetical protein
MTRYDICTGTSKWKPASEMAMTMEELASAVREELPRLLQSVKVAHDFVASDWSNQDQFNAGYIQGFKPTQELRFI